MAKNITLTNNKTTITVTVGQQGPQGIGVPAGGSTGQFLQKIDGTDFNTQWTTSGSSISWGGITGTITDQTDLINEIEENAVAMAIALGS